MRRSSLALLSHRTVGAEPGIDPRRESAFVAYGHIKQQCLIEVVDYSSVRSSFGRMTNQEFVRLMQDDRASAKEPWVKVRWINVGGISWDVISALAIKYDMHPLAVEDVLQFRKNARSKVDYYPKHLFLRVLCHTVDDDDDSSAVSLLPEPISGLPRTLLSQPIFTEPEEIDSMDKSQDVPEAEVWETTPSASPRFTSRSSTLRNTVKRTLNKQADIESVTVPNLAYGLPSEVKTKKLKDARNARLIQELKKGERVNVRITPMCMFLFRDGTVITFHHDTKLTLTTPISERLRQRDTGLRTTADASMLVQSLLDLVVDEAMEVIQEYQSRILKLEQAVLLKPHMKHVRRLHILQGDLILHKRTLNPIKSVIYGLRRYDDDRAAALENNGDPSMKVRGFMTHKAKIYLADVHDHMEYILASLDMFAGVSDNLINYTFNMTSYQMNEVMRRLTLTTIICLPLTLLTGYFGMNFNNMWSVNHGHTDIIFWIIALPVMSIVLPIFLWSDFTRVLHYIQKRLIKEVEANSPILQPGVSELTAFWRLSYTSQSDTTILYQEVIFKPTASGRHYLEPLNIVESDRVPLSTPQYGSERWKR
ncbi:hypothetical protein NM688_g9275 [Phlebia brevispora]|uniref:Uncharacterized protein n=1 Tax=Phlebia brevispora TaxID=194682 RepID=A0ACC1RHE9_9APHY|nr:hypothetical protein NM688_g9275 [Phlebia brevispora]